MCLAQGPQRSDADEAQTTPPRSRVKHSTTEPLCSVVSYHLLKQRFVLNGPRREKTCLGGIANNTGADQPAHLRSLISAFVIRV